MVPNVPVTFLLGDTTWTPGNAEKSAFEGRMVSLTWGLAHSSDWIAAWVMKQFNPPSVIDIMHKMGFTSHLTPVPSLVLGTSDVTLYEVVGAYSAFANKGIYTKPNFVTRIEDKSGNVLATFTPEKVEAISEQTAYLMLNMLECAVNYGTGYAIRGTYNFKNPIAGKTGTTQHHSDGWFTGVTPNLVTCVWVGAEDRSIHFGELGLGAGGHMALPIWAYYMQKVYADKSLHISQADFEAPAGFNYNLSCPDTDVKDLNDDDLKNIENEGY
jgi:penicillin-binding protein 1A